MKMTRLIALCTLLALLLLPAALVAQEVAAPERGVVEFGVRGVTGDVYGRTNRGDVPFSNGFRPDLLTSNLNTYSDFRNGFYMPKFNLQMENFLGTKSYFHLQSASNGLAFEGGGNLNRDQSYLATFGHYGLYKIQFRFDETPHIFSGTTRTLLGSASPGVWKVNPALQSALSAAILANSTSTTTSATNISNAVTSAVAGTLVSGVPGVQLLTQQENRKTVGALASWNVTPNWDAKFQFSHEQQIGTRPLGMVMGNGAGGYQLDIPESIDYQTTNVKVASEFGQKHWDGLIGFQTSMFHNNIPSMVVDNPFSTVYNNTTAGPKTGRESSYPDSRYDQFQVAGTTAIGKYVRLMANIVPGVMTQNAPFQAISTNDSSVVTGGTNLASPAKDINGNVVPNLPQANLNGRVDTLALNSTAVLTPIKHVQLVAKFQRYDYGDHTPDLLVRDVIGDTSLAGTGNLCSATGMCQSERTSFTRDTFDASGTWFFTKKNSATVGFQREWMNRENRNVGHSGENTVYGAVDLNLRKDLLLRVSGRHQNRVPEAYDNEYPNSAATDVFYLRMMDQAARLRNRGDVLLQWNATQRLSVSAFAGTLQDNYNIRGGVNSSTPLGDISHSLLGCQIGYYYNALPNGGANGVQGNATFGNAGSAGSNGPTTWSLGTVAYGRDPIAPSGCVVTTGPLQPITKLYGNYYAYGLLNSIGRNYGADANYALTKNVTVFAEYVREKNTGVIMDGNQKYTPNDLGTSTTNPFVITGRNCALTTGGGTNNPGHVAGYWATSGCDPINDVVTFTKDLVDTYLGGADFSVTKKLDISAYYSLSAAQSFIKSDGVNCQIGNGLNRYCQQHFANWSLDNVNNPALTFGYPEDVSRIHEVSLIARIKLTSNLIPKFQYTYRQWDNKDWQTGVMNPYSFVGAATDPGANPGALNPLGVAVFPTGTNPVSAMQKFLSLGADQPSYRAHIFSATLEYHF